MSDQAEEPASEVERLADDLKTHVTIDGGKFNVNAEEFTPRNKSGASNGASTAGQNDVGQPDIPQVEGPGYPYIQPPGLGVTWSVQPLRDVHVYVPEDAPTVHRYSYPSGPKRGMASGRGGHRGKARAPPPQPAAQDQPEGSEASSAPDGEAASVSSTVDDEDDRVPRTVFITDIDKSVTEEQLACVFGSCGQVADCRICGDPNSALRFAVIEFCTSEGANKALEMHGLSLGAYPIRVTRSRTAIVPVNPELLPKDEKEREQCSRTVYVANIDKSVSQLDVKHFFESLCGPVSRFRLLGDYDHPTRIAFVEFSDAEHATAALNCSGATLGKLPIRVSPSKTPVRQNGRQRRKWKPKNRHVAPQELDMAHARSIPQPIHLPDPRYSAIHQLPHDQLHPVHSPTYTIVQPVLQPDMAAMESHMYPPAAAAIPQQRIFGDQMQIASVSSPIQYGSHGVAAPSTFNQAGELA